MKRWRIGIWVLLVGVMIVAWAAAVAPTEAQTLVLSRSTDMVLTAVDWHPNGELIAVSSWNGIYVYSTGLEEVITVADSDDQWFSAEWSPDGQRLAATNNTSRVTHIWDFDDVNHQFESQIQLPNLGNYEGMIGAHWSPDGTQMITIGDYTTNTDYYGEYQLWDTFSGTRIAVLPFQFGFYTPSVEWSPDGSYIVGGGRFRCPLTQPEGSCDVYGDVMFVVNVSDISAPFWFEEMLIEPNDVAWLTQNTVALLGTFELEIFDFASRERIFMLDNYQNFRMDGSPWGGYVALTSLEGEIGIFDVSTNRVIANFQTGAKNITSLDWSVDNRLVVVDGTGVIEIWDLNALLIQTAIPTPTPAPTSMPITLPAETSLALPQTGVDSNAEWSPYIQPFDGVLMALVPAGCFRMGSKDDDLDEQPEHPQCFDEPFWIDVYEVTNGHFMALDGTAIYSDFRRNFQYSIGNITWFEAREFCENRRGGRLPTEREWEYAAPGVDNLSYPWHEESDFDGYESHIQSSQPVGSEPYDVSCVGAYDLAANVIEWTSSAYLDYPYSFDDGRENLADRETRRVIRGGAGTIDKTGSRLAARFGLEPDNGVNSIIGFRCARSYS
jgi:WD40 repeat protein